MKHEEYYHKLEKALDYIEKNLSKDISLHSISQYAFSSLSHFHRIFFFMTGQTIKEYIRNRRLTQAAIQLISTKNKITDIALEAQFESPESFNRAFKKIFGLSPREFRNKKPEFTITPKLKLEQHQSLIMPANISLAFVFLPEQYISGFRTRTTLAGQQQTIDIPNFFAKVMQQSLLQKIPNVLDPSQIIGVYSDMSDEEEFDYTVGLWVKKPTQTAIICSHKLPAAEYARFTVQGDASGLADAWQFIYGYWMPYSGRARQKGLDFEVYFADKTDIYIPMQSK